MSLADVVADLIALQRLVDTEPDPERRNALEAVRARLAAREGGARIADAARLLGLTAPTTRSWLESGVLDGIPGAAPARVEVLSLAAVKHALDLLREHGDDQDLLVAVMRTLRDRAALAGAEEGFADLRAGRVVSISDGLLEEIAAIKLARPPTN